MKYYLFWLLAFLFVLGCKTDNETYEINPNLPQLRADWEREYAAWQALDIQNYQFNFARPETYGDNWHVTITVKNGNCYSAVDWKGYQYDDSFKFTINEYFMKISNTFDMIENGPEDPDVIYVSIEIRYDPEYHFPAYISHVRVYKKSLGGVGGNGSEDVIKNFAILEESTT